MLREKGSIRAGDVKAQAIRDKGLAPENRKLRAVAIVCGCGR
jgi:hypothetical protein